MKRLFEKLKRMPSDKKRIYSLIIAFVLTVLVVAVWLFIDSHLNKKDDIKDIKQEESTKKLKESFQNIFKPLEDLPNIISSTSKTLISATSTNQ
jgi:uncharacterized membrane protein required for colicin V production